jgi:hypothetical protein
MAIADESHFNSEDQGFLLHLHLQVMFLSVQCSGAHQRKKSLTPRSSFILKPPKKWLRFSPFSKESRIYIFQREMTTSKHRIS